ncbi:DUF805 domain-containing protein [Maricaulis sp. CAU 1757]
MSVLSDLKYNFANLTNFRGRDSRDRFWPFAGLILLLGYFGSMLAMIPQMTEFMVQAFLTPPDAPADVLPLFSGLMRGMALVSALTVASLAAAVTRRLRDRGVSKAWGVVPAILVFTGMAVMYTLFRQALVGEPDMTLFTLGMANNLIYLAAFAALFLQLAGNSKKAPQTR